MSIINSNYLCPHIIEFSLIKTFQWIIFLLSHENYHRNDKATVSLNESGSTNVDQLNWIYRNICAILCARQLKSFVNKNTVSISVLCEEGKKSQTMICSKSKQINSSYKLIIIVHNAYLVFFISINWCVVCVLISLSPFLFLSVIY